MKFFLETVSLSFLVILVTVDAGTQHHLAKRNNIQIRDIHVPHPRLRRVYFLQHASKETLNNLESHDNSNKDEVEVLPAKTKYDSTKQVPSATTEEATSDTTLEAATTSLPKEELVTTIPIKEPEHPDAVSSGVKSPPSSNDVKEPELPSGSEKIKTPPSSSDVKEPELPEQNEEQKILIKQHRRDVYYLNKQYENKDETKKPLPLEVPSKLESLSPTLATELQDEPTTSLPMNLDKKKSDLKNPEKVDGEEPIKDNKQKPASTEAEKPAKEDETEVKKPVQEVEPKEEEPVERKKRELYNFNLKQEEKKKVKKETLKLNKPYLPLKTDKEKTPLPDDELNKKETSTPESEETVPLDTSKKESLLNTKKTEEESVPLDIKKKDQEVPSEIVEAVTESKLEETTTLESKLEETSTLGEVKLTDKDITTISSVTEETPKSEISVEKRQKRNQYSLLEDKEKPVPLMNKKIKVEENTLSPTDITILPIIESLTSLTSSEESKTDNMPTITKTNYKKKDTEAPPALEEEKETEDKQKGEKLPDAIKTNKEEDAENGLDDKKSEETKDDKELYTSLESEYKKKDSNQETKSSQPSDEKVVEERKKRNSYKYFPIKEEQKEPQLPDDESDKATTPLEDKVEEVTMSSNEKVTELNDLTTAKEMEQVTLVTEESMTTPQPNEKEPEKKETPIVKSRLRRNTYYNKLQEQAVKKEEIKKKYELPLKNEENKQVESISKPDESTSNPDDSNSKPIEPISQSTEEISTLNSLLTTEKTSESNNLVETVTEETTSIKNDEKNKTEENESPQEN